MTPGQPQKTCPACGTVNRPDCRFCTGCGREFPKERTCPRCNATLSESQRFCNSCGAPADAASAQQQATGQMKFCHHCRALIDRNAKFCNICGTVLSQLPVCPRCGDPIGPEEKFCGVCGLPFTTAAPARQAPVQPSQPVHTVPPQPHYQPVMQPIPVKKGRISFGKIAIGVVIVLVVLVGIVMLLPDSTTPPPPDGGTGGKTGTTGFTGGSTAASIIIPSDEDNAATQNSIDASNAVLQMASKALAEGDTAGFLSALAPDYRKAVEGSTLNTQNTQKIADAMKNAKVVSAFPEIVYYEMTVDNKPFAFYTIVEEGSWKIAGL